MPNQPEGERALITHHSLSNDEVRKPLSPHFFSDSRPTVAGLLITPRQGIVLVQNDRALEGQLVPPQGGVENKKGQRESVLEAFLREVSEEVPKIKVRKTSAVFLFDCKHSVPGTERNCWPEKWMFWFAVLADDVPPYEAGMPGFLYEEVRSVEELDPYLKRMSPGKHDMVVGAISAASRRGMLSWSFGARSASDQAA